MKIYIRATEDYDIDRVFTTDAYVREDLARTTNSAELLEIYAYDPNQRVRCAVAGNVHTPSDVLEELVDDPFVRKTVLSNPNTPTELLVQYSHDQAAGTRCAVANNVKTPSEILDELANDPDFSVRCNVARNSNTSPEIIKQLSRDPDHWLRRLAVANKNFPKVTTDDLPDYADNPEALRKLVMDRKTSADVLQQIQTGNYQEAHRALAQSRRTPSDVLTQLASERDYYVQYYLVRNPKLPKAAMMQLVNHGCVDAKMYLLKHRNLPTEVYEALSKDDIDRIRRTVAEKISDPVLLSKLADDRKAQVRAAACHNWNTPVAALRKHANDRSQDVRWYIANRHDLPEDIIKALIDEFPSSIMRTNQLSADMLDELEQTTTGDYTRRLIASQANASNQLLMKLANDPDWNTKQVAKNALLKRGIDV